MIKIAVANMKGGVGKSTTAMMLADALALHHQQNVLIIDCDPQANLSQMMLSFSGLHSANASGNTITAWLESLNGTTVNGQSIGIRRTAHTTYRGEISDLAEFKPGYFRKTLPAGQVSIWPATPDLRFAELMFDHLFFQAGDKDSPRLRLIEDLQIALSEFGDMFDVVLFDCPPGFSTTAQAALSTSDVVISPVNVDRVSLWSLRTFWNQGLDDTLGGVARTNRFALLTMVRRNSGGKEERKQIRRDISEFAGQGRLGTEIPLSVEALRFVHRPAPDSIRSFKKKYGALRSQVEALGKEVMAILAKLKQEKVG